MDTTTLWTRNKKTYFWDNPDARGYRVITVEPETVTIRQYLPVMPGQLYHGPKTEEPLPDFVVDAQIENEAGFYLAQEDTITLADLGRSNEFQDGSIFVFYSVSLGKYKGLFNLLAATAYSRMISHNYRFGCTSLIPIAFLYVQSVKDDFLNMKWVFIQDIRSPSKTNLDAGSVQIESVFDETGMLKMYGFVRFELSLNTESDEAFLVDVRAVEEDGSLSEKELSMYLQTNTGYLPKRKLTFTGQTQFKVCKLGLEAGDVVEVKAGYKFWQNTTRLLLEVGRHVSA